MISRLTSYFISQPLVQEQESQGNMDCQICTEPVDMKDSISHGKKHPIHKACFEVWAKARQSQGFDIPCPSCRVPVTAEGKDVPITTDMKLESMREKAFEILVPKLEAWSNFYHKPSGMAATSVFLTVMSLCVSQYYYADENFYAKVSVGVSASLGLIIPLQIQNLKTLLSSRHISPGKLESLHLESLKKHASIMLPAIATIGAAYKANLL